QLTHNGVAVTKLPLVAKGQRVNAEDREFLRKVVCTERSVNAVGLRPCASAVYNTARDRVAGTRSSNIVDRLGEGVVGGVAQTMPRTLRERDLQGVVVAVTNVAPAIGHARVLRERLEHLADSGRRTTIVAIRQCD